MRYARRTSVIVVLALSSGFLNRAADPPVAKKKLHPSKESTQPVLWRDPEDIASRNLFYGPGGEQDQPGGTFTFIEEDLSGTNPKIVVRDQDGVKWTVKMGPEARPETAASRLVWGIGYFANEDYFLPGLKVERLPAKLHRAGDSITADGTMHNIRLKRHLKNEKKVGHWSWRDDPFTATREWNALRVLMALMNNWDLTDDNNAIYTEDGSSDKAIYMVSDVGSTFGSGRLTWPMGKSRGSLREYMRSKFITKITPDYVNLFVPDRDSFVFLATPREYMQKLRLRWIGRRIPRADAKWLGDQLGRLSRDQIRDAFRAAQYSPEEIEGFASVIELRIAALEEL